MSHQGAYRRINNRESLQSRLLERMTTKKQRSPQEIYLEEELSSDEDDDKVQESENEEDSLTERKEAYQREKEAYDEENAADVEDSDNQEQEKTLKENGNKSRQLKSKEASTRINKNDGSYKEDLKDKINNRKALNQQDYQTKFKVGSEKQSKTQSGNQFVDFRKTFQNFHGNSQKALNDIDRNNNNKVGQASATSYGMKFIDGFARNSSVNRAQGFGDPNKYDAMKMALSNQNSYSKKGQEYFDKSAKPQANNSTWKQFAMTSNKFQGSNQANLPTENLNKAASNRQQEYQQERQAYPQKQDNSGAGNFGRKTFYVSDYQKKKQQKEWGLRAGADNQTSPMNLNFHKPRALSRQADAHIQIEVHRDQNIRNHLQRDQQENMNLMFYDFNGSSGQQQMNTAQNFYQNNGQRPVTGDRVPTRDRYYRSAHQQLRRRGGAVNPNTDPASTYSDLQNVY